jgi:hypothetical protein
LRQRSDRPKLAAALGHAKAIGWTSIPRSTHHDALYEDLDEAAAVLAAFIEVTGLPKPSIIVCTGGGLQPYWCMLRELTPHEWR